MADLLGTLAAPVIGAVTSLIGGASANAASAQSVATQEAFQERMSDTSYQRGMADMKAAGLNPMLAYAQGGASSPSGASYTAQNVAAGMPQFASSVNSALTIPSQIEQNEAQAGLADEQGLTQESQRALIAAQTAYQRALDEGATADNASKKAYAAAVNLNPKFVGKFNLFMDMFKKVMQESPLNLFGGYAK